MLDQLQAIQDRATEELAQIADSKELATWEQKYLGRKGELPQLLRGVGKLPPEERPAAGRKGNEVKTALTAAYEQRQAEIKQAEMSEGLLTDRVDVSLPGRVPKMGRMHPTTRTLREIYAIFAAMGFQVYDAPDVDSDENNFELLNIPKHHPARDMWDTFYVNENVVMRTHTSPGQIRAMRDYYPEPIRVILPGKCYRYEQVTARSEFMFYQVEGLAVGKNITMGDLKGTLANFARQLFGAERRVRFRCSHFPFTEPSMEVDMDCIICKGDGCRLCKYTGWLEISGAGMVHPVVLRNGGYDPDVYSGFAFGMGVERPNLLKYGIEDIRLFYSNDLRFLSQFG